MNFYFRTNFGEKEGLGHFSRIYNLYKNLNKKYICKIVVDKRKKLFLKKNIKINNIYSKSEKFISELDDARKFANSISKNKKSIVIVDDYRLGYTWEKFISKHCYKVIRIDDDENRRHFADILIIAKTSFNDNKNNQLLNLKKLNKKKCKFLLGSRYAIINTKFKKIKKKNKKFDLVFYNGGSGNPLIYYNLIKELLTSNIINNKHLLIHIIIGPLVNNKKKIINLFSKFKKIKLHQNVNNLGKILHKSNILVSSAGIINTEAAYYKIPTILIKMVKNQDINRISLESIGHYILLKKSDLIYYKKFSRLISLLINQYKRFKKITTKPKILVDNKGVNRIIKEMIKYN